MKARFTETTKVSLTPELMSELDELAEERASTRAALIREAVVALVRGRGVRNG